MLPRALIGGWRGCGAMLAVTCAVAAWWLFAPERVVADEYTRRMWDGPPVKITFLTTNDLHSSADGCCGPDSSPEIKKGGYDRLVHTIDRVRNSRGENSVVLTLDAGDWFSGTAFSALGPNAASSAAPELSYFDAAKYDAIVLGNHGQRMLLNPGPLRVSDL